MINLSHLLFPKGRKGIAGKSGKTVISLTPHSRQYRKMRQKFEIPLCSCASQYRGGKIVANCRTQFNSTMKTWTNPPISNYKSIPTIRLILEMSHRHMHSPVQMHQGRPVPLRIEFLLYVALNHSSISVYRKIQLHSSFCVGVLLMFVYC